MSTNMAVVTSLANQELSSPTVFKLQLVLFANHFSPLSHNTNTEARRFRIIRGFKKASSEVEGKNIFGSSYCGHDLYELGKSVKLSLAWCINVEIF